MPLDSERINLGGVLVWDEGTKESYRKFGTSKAVRTVLCYWNQRNTLINALFGFGGINVTEQQQYQPDTPYPDAPSLLFVSEMDTIGIAGPGGLTTDGLGLVAYKYARVQITYSSLPYNQNNLNVVSLDFGVKEISIPGQVFKYKDTGNAVPAEAFPALRVVTVTITIQQFNQPVLPMSVVTSVAGYVNASDFLGLPEGTVLFNGAKTNRRMAVNGHENHDCTFCFEYNPQGWQKVIESGANPIFQAIEDSNGNPPFTEGDLSVLGVENEQGLIGS